MKEEILKAIQYFKDRQGRYMISDNVAKHEGTAIVALQEQLKKNDMPKYQGLTPQEGEAIAKSLRESIANNFNRTFYNKIESEIAEFQGVPMEKVKNWHKEQHKHFIDTLFKTEPIRLEVSCGHTLPTVLKLNEKELEKNMNKEKIKSIVTSGDCVNAIVEQLANYFEEQSKLKTQALERADTDLKVLRAEFKGYKQGCADMYNSFE